ncbi:hypothetical protein NKG94_35835 [Micromonospora sp. M12]
MPLSQRPVQRALALFQPLTEEARADGPVRVLGNDGVVRNLDVVTLAPTGTRAATRRPP